MSSLNRRWDRHDERKMKGKEKKQNKASLSVFTRNRRWDGVDGVRAG
jgi:hypothetical protein